MEPQEHSDHCNCEQCVKEAEEWTRLNTCEVCDDLLDVYGICEFCAEVDFGREERKHTKGISNENIKIDK